MEEPGYNKASAVFQNNGCIIECVPVDKDGLCTEKLLGETDIGGIYCTPSHQFPTGSVLTISRRYELLKWAEEQDSFVLEDDYDSELQYYTKPIPYQQSIDNHDRVIYFGTFSKALSPSIRMGYMILPKRLLEKYHQLFNYYNSTVPLLNQYVIGSLIEDGQYDRHIRRLSNIFRKRMTCFCKEISKNLSPIKVIGNSRAQYCLLEFPPNLKQEELIRKAEINGVKVYSTMQFWQEKADCPPNTLFMGLCKIKVEDIPDCVTRLKNAWAEVLYY